VEGEEEEEGEEDDDEKKEEGEPEDVELWIDNEDVNITLIIIRENLMQALLYTCSFQPAMF